MKQPSIKNKQYHFIGVGGAGANMLELFVRKGVPGKFTMITYPYRDHLTDIIHQIPFETDSYKSKSKIGQPITLPNTVKNHLSSNEEYVLLLGLGGYTGTKLTEVLIAFLSERRQNFSVLYNLPLPFEFNRIEYAQEFVNQHNHLPNVHKINIQKIYENNKDKLLNHVFHSINKAIFNQWKKLEHI